MFASHTSLGRFFLLAAIALGALAPTLYAWQLRSGSLATPWYMPILGTLAAASAVAAFVQSRGFVRGSVAVALAAIAGFEWSILAVTRLPAYDGPLAVGTPFPDFTAKSADGSPFGREDLVGERHTAFVFFRGRW